MTMRDRLEYLKQRGISMRTVANVADVDNSTISKYVAGDTAELSDEVRQKVETALTTIANDIMAVVRG